MSGSNCLIFCNLWRSFIRVLIAVIFVVCSAVSAFGSADGRRESIEQAQAALEKWVETQRLISQEKRDFELSREMLRERIELVEREIESLRGKISDAEDSIAEADKKRSELLEENEQLKAATDSLKGTLVSLEQETKTLLRSVCDPIRDRVKPLSQRLPETKPLTDKDRWDETKSTTKLTVAERFQNVIGILNEIDKFNNEISVNSEVRELPDGSSIEVTALYVGIGQGFYVSANGKVAGKSKLTYDGWKWVESNDAADEIAESIAILKNEKPASFIKLPVEIQ